MRKSLIQNACYTLLTAVGLSATSAAAIGRPSSASLYVRARAAEVAGDARGTSVHYAALLAQDGVDPLVATRAFRAALAAGDMPLALKAARLLAARQMLPPDACLLLVVDAMRQRDWRTAATLTDRIAQDRAFALLVPFVRGWIAFGGGQGDAVERIEGARTNPLSAPYVPEQHALVLIALGRREEGMAVLGPQAAGRLPRQVPDAAHGLAPLLLNVAADLGRQNGVAPGMVMARLATFAAPDDARGWLLLAQLLQRMQRSDLALAAVAHVAPDDPLAEGARGLRIALLNAAGRRPAALAEAAAAAHEPHATSYDWSRAGELYLLDGQSQPAAEAFGRALTLAEAAHAPPDEVWPILLQLGNAFDQGGDWPHARAALQRAYALAPHDPVVLNQVGYGEIEHREDIAHAGAMIVEASRARPEDAAITDSLGWSLHLQGRDGDAIPLLERAAAGAPGEAAINEHLGDVYWTTGRIYEARYAWRAALLTADDKDKARLAAKVDVGLGAATAAP